MSVNRCFDCNRYVPLEVEDGGVSTQLKDGAVSGTVLLLLCCGECGATLGEFDAKFACRTTDFKEVY